MTQKMPFPPATWAKTGSEGVCAPAPGLRLALFEPDIPQNAGSLLRLGACLGVGVDLIEPCGFLLTDRGLKRAGMDYLKTADFRRHESWDKFLGDRFLKDRDGAAAGTIEGRLVLLTTKADMAYADFAFRAGDTLLVGRESAGVPDHVHDRADARVRIAMVQGMRSINVAQAAAMVLGEALRQTGLGPRQPS